MKSLSSREVEYIERTHGLCPRCNAAPLVIGPQEGSTVSCRCDPCGADFMLYVVAGSEKLEVVAGYMLDPSPVRRIVYLDDAGPLHGLLAERMA